MAKEKKIKEPIRVRQKPLQNGNISLYLGGTIADNHIYDLQFICV